MLLRATAVRTSIRTLKLTRRQPSPRAEGGELPLAATVNPLAAKAHSSRRLSRVKVVLNEGDGGRAAALPRTDASVAGGGAALTESPSMLHALALRTDSTGSHGSGYKHPGAPAGGVAVRRPAMDGRVSPRGQRSRPAGVLPAVEHAHGSNAGVPTAPAQSTDG
jgi:hypothetical protein